MSKTNISSPFNSPPLGRDRAFQWTLRLSALIAGSLTIVIFLFLLKEALPVFQTIQPTRLATDQGWHPTENEFNLLPMVVGTLLVSFFAVAIATPLGFLSALFCRFFAPRPIAAVYRRTVELMSGIPSVVYGFWGLVVLVPLINKFHPPGPSLLAGTLILSFMILPLVALVAESHFQALPRELLLGVEALGLSKWRWILFVAFPAAKPGLITSVLLETGRAIGETMAVLMVCGNIVQFPSSVFDPIRTLTANIALEMAYALDFHRSLLFTCGAFLLVLVGALIWFADFLTEKHHDAA